MEQGRYVSVVKYDTVINQSNTIGICTRTEIKIYQTIFGIFLWTEKLPSLLINFFYTTQADKSGIVEEAVKYIKALEDTVQRLEKQKLEKLQGSNSFPSIAGSSKQAMFSTREKFIADQVSAINHNNNNLAIERTNRRTSSSHLLPAIIQTWSSANECLRRWCTVCNLWAQEAGSLCQHLFRTW